MVINVIKSTLLSNTIMPNISSSFSFKLFSFSFSSIVSQKVWAKSPLIYLYLILPKQVSNLTTAFAKSLTQDKFLSIYISLILSSFSKDNKSISIGIKSIFKFSILKSPIILLVVIYSIIS